MAHRGVGFDKQDLILFLVVQVQGFFKDVSPLTK